MLISETMKKIPLLKYSHQENKHIEQYSEKQLKVIVYDTVRSIKDPEKPFNLEDLDVVYEDGIEVSKGLNGDEYVYRIRVEFKPTIPHCNLATLIGLCIRMKLKENLHVRYKLTIRVKEGSHVLADDVNKQINDKERVAAAMENKSLKQFVLNCIKNEE
ncbi:unnamed protein product [Nezara viridula]|uniref:MIP18 family-like domain-containing protein n=1 Tax=Nezara viridula TaxID=85310 RepID=A0A9P0E4R1_NEZVI|nr:unnamed protein product [Nezara viridula]